MPRVSTYLNFERSTEAAFLFYRAAFGTEFIGPIRRYADMPAAPGQPPLDPADAPLVMHVELPILGGHVLMGTDVPRSMGATVTAGNNVHINLEPDTRAETDRLFQALAEGAVVDTPLQEMFWGGYFGSLTDRFGLHWTFNCQPQAPVPGEPAASPSDIYPSLTYQDAPAAIAWLCRAFGFRRRFVVPGEAGRVEHSELSLGTGVVMVSSPKAEDRRASPKGLVGVAQAISVFVADPDAHHTVAVAAGARVARPLQTEDYGARGYMVLDLEDHLWYFGNYRPGAYWDLPEGENR